MNDLRGILDAQIESLRESLRGQSERRCREIEDAAVQEAQRIKGEGRATQRARLRQAVEEERHRRRLALLQAERRIETRERQRTQGRYVRLLRDAWPALLEELGRRWSEEGERRAWCELLIDEAKKTLVNVSWIIEHPDDWHEKDSRWLTAVLADEGLPKPSFRAVPGIGEGLRIRHETACLDGTVVGLLANREGIEADLLAAWERLSQAAEDEQRG